MDKPNHRPLKFKDAKALQKAIDAYFAECIVDDWEDVPARDKNGKHILDEKGKWKMKPVRVKRVVQPITISGLAVALDTSRETLLDYEEKDDFSDTIKKAKEQIKSWTEGKLFGGCHPSGVIFNLKNNWGFKDEQKVEHSGELTQRTVNIIQPKPNPKAMLEMKNVTSSNVKAIGYLEEKRLLRIRFKDGSAYDYMGIEEEMYIALMASESKGKFIAEKIKDKFLYKKVADAETPKVQPEKTLAQAKSEHSELSALAEKKA